MKADAKTEAEVMAVLDNFSQALEKRELESFLALFATDFDVVFIGTGVDEKCVGMEEIKEHIKRNFSKSEGLSVQFGWHSVSTAGSVALVAADTYVRIKTAEKEMKVLARLSAVLDKREDTWQIVHWHWSVPLASWPFLQDLVSIFSME